MRDLRDPEALGAAYLLMRKAGVPIEHACQVHAVPYWDGGVMSSDPRKHHSQTPQNIDLQEGNEE